MDRINTSNYSIRLIGSPAKDIVIHHNRLKLWYGTPQEVTAPSAISPTTDQLYSDVVCRSIRTPAGGYTSSTNDPPPGSVSPITRPQRNRGSLTRHNDYVRH